MAPSARHRLTRRLLRTAAIAATAITVPAAVAWAHDFWIVPNAFAIAVGDVLEIRAQTSSQFPTSVAAVAVERIIDARLVGPAGTDSIRELSIGGTSLVLRHRPRTAGQYVVAVGIRAPRTVRESPAAFRRYVELEGAPELVERYTREGRMPTTDSVTRRSTKFAKTLVRVGSGGAMTYDRVVGHPLEFVPLTDPLAMRAGDTLRVRLLYRGAPLAGARVHAGAAGAGTPTGAAATRAVEQSPMTDARGEARIALTTAGLWNVRAIHVAPSAAGSGADWDVYWGSFVFATADGANAAAAAMRAAPMSAAPMPAGAAPAAAPATAANSTPGDSAAVAGVVRAYHQAMDQGDSTRALTFLAPDVVILESGGEETLAEYRSHHLAGDIGYAKAVPGTTSAVRVTVVGDAAWASSTSVNEGQYRGRAVNSAGAELMVLARGADGRWMIRAIHWSSRARRPATAG